MIADIVWLRTMGCVAGSEFSGAADLDGGGWFCMRNITGSEFADGAAAAAAAGTNATALAPSRCILYTFETIHETVIIQKKGTKIPDKIMVVVQW